MNHQDGGNGNLERHPEGEKQLEDEVQVLGHVGHHRHAFRPHAGKKPEYQREHHEIGERHTAVEQHHTGGQQRQSQPLFMGVQTGGDKGPDLVQNKRRGQQHRHKQGELEWCQEGGGHVGGDHPRRFGQEFLQRGRRQGVNIVGKVEQAQKDHQHDNDDPQQAIAQFDQVLNQGQFFVVRGYGHARAQEEGVCESRGALAGSDEASVGSESVPLPSASRVSVSAPERLDESLLFGSVFSSGSVCA